MLPAIDQASLAFQLRLVLIGAAGTGKSTVLRMVEALTDKFFGPMSMRKGAPSNAAARLIGGDTVHALLTLPLFGGLNGAQGHLTDPVKRTLRRKWKGARPTYRGELRM